MHIFMSLLVRDRRVYEKQNYWSSELQQKYADEHI